MDPNERKRFWNELLLAKDDGDSEKIGNTLRIPEKLYRYRGISSKSLDALKDNMLFFSTSDYYDDPFDTYIRFDKEEVKAACRKLNMDDVIYEEVCGLFHEVRNMIRKRTWSICFSESFLNESLWLKYAGNHRGFVLEYEVSDIGTAPFGVYSPVNCNAMNNCMKNRIIGDSLLPVYYSDKPYDASEYACFVGICYLLEKKGETNRLNELLQANPYSWEAERVILIKKLIHRFDEEWRLILKNTTDVVPGTIPYKKCVPLRVILGLNINENDELVVMKNAKQAGIRVVDKVIIDDKDELNTMRLWRG